MATNLVVNFLGNNKLSKTTTVISRDLKNLGKLAETTGAKMSRALGAVGLGLGLAKTISLLKESTKAAAADSVSKNQLALALRNTVGANSQAILGAEKWIESVSNSVAIVDDELRPALATAVRATGSLTQGQALLSLALDVSAGTGRDLQQVTKAIARAQQGQLGGLQKLVPGIKAGADWMDQLRTQFKGAAETAANADPYKKLTIIFDNLKESIGYELLPYVQQFTDYLKSPEGQANLKQIVSILVSIGKLFGTIIGFVINNISLIKGLAAGYIYVKSAIFVMTLAMKAYDIATKVATVSTKALKIALITSGIGAIVVAVGTLAASWLEASSAVDEYTAAQEGMLPGAETPGKLTFINDRLLNANLFQYTHYAGVTQAMRDVLFKYKGALIEIDLMQGTILADGKEIFRQDTWQALSDKMADSADKIKKSAEKFRDSIGLAFGTFGKDEYSVFNIDVVIDKLKRMVNAAKGFASNIAKLKKAGAGQDVINELIGMGPAQGNIVAQGLLQSGRLSEYLGLRGSLYGTGAAVQGEALTASTANYTINVNKANMSADEIIRAIQTYEKKTGRKYFAN